MRLKVLVDAGDKVMGTTLPFAAIGIVANVIWPAVFRIGLGSAATIIGLGLLIIGIPLWLTSVALILINVPKKRLITNGPYALMLHPLYTSIALLVIPGCGLLFDSWVGLAIGAVLYFSSRVFSVREEELLEKFFPVEYPTYRGKVIMPWL